MTSPAILATIAIGVLSACSATGAITMLNTGSKVVPDDSGTPNILDGSTSTLAFDAGASADMLIVALSSERSTQAPITISYNGAALTAAPANDDRSGIWYLANPDTGGAFDLTVSFVGIGTVNGYGMGVVSVTSGGMPIVLDDSTPQNGTSSVSITTTAADSFVVVNGFANEGPGTKSAAVDAPLSALYGSSDIGSAIGAAGYEEGVAAGVHNYSISYTGFGTPVRTVAASFVAVPEPGSLALLGLGGLLLARRRR